VATARPPGADGGETSDPVVALVLPGADQLVPSEASTKNVYPVPGCSPETVALVPVTRWTEAPWVQAAYCTTPTLSVEGLQVRVTLV